MAKFVLSINFSFRRDPILDSSSNNLPALLATIIPTLSDAPVRLQGKALKHVFESPAEIFQSIREFYFKETLNQIYKIIGSLDFVGNPTMLVTSFISGMRDLVVAPSTAFSKSPTDATKLGLGVAQGALLAALGPDPHERAAGGHAQPRARRGALQHA